MPPALSESLDSLIDRLAAVYIFGLPLAKACAVALRGRVQQLGQTIEWRARLFGYCPRQFGIFDPTERVHRVAVREKITCHAQQLRQMLLCRALPESLGQREEGDLSGN